MREGRNRKIIPQITFKTKRKEVHYLKANPNTVPVITLANMHYFALPLPHYRLLPIYDATSFNFFGTELPETDFTIHGTM